MLYQKLKSKLCYYDKRNPNNNSKYSTPENCCCNNCFQGITSLAEYTLKLKYLLAKNGIKETTTVNEVTP